MAAESFEIINHSLSWPTRLSRTRVSSTQDLSLSEASNPNNLNLDDILRTVQYLGLKLCLYSEIENLTVLGEGESFRVDQCIYRKKTVAVKHIKLNNVQKDSHALNRRLRTVLNEIRIMHHGPLREHPNILSVLGYGWRQSEQALLPYMIVEYATYGSLRKYLMGSPRSLRSKIILAGDVAAGLNALHQCDIVHGDLKLENIVVLESWDRPSAAIAKLCDFGHSIVLAADKKYLKYYGTLLYNPPEVENQDVSPIDPVDLPRCDMWAYGLALWEIFLDGATFFKKSWLDEISFAKSWPESLVSDGRGTEDLPADTDIDVSDTLALGREESGRTLFGRLDPKHLSRLANEFINSINFRGGFVDKAILRKFLSQALKVDPKDRPSRVTLGPLMSTWNPADVNTLRAKLSIHTGSAAWSFNLLRPDQEKEILWEHQSQILNDFIEICKRHKTPEEAGSAAFQIAMCYMTGFGTNKELQTSAKFLETSEEHGHPPAKLFGQALRRSLSNFDQFNEILTYETRVIRGLKLAHHIGPTTKLSVQWKHRGPKAVGHNEIAQAEVLLPLYDDLTQVNANKDSTVTRLFPSYAEFKTWITSCVGDESESLLLTSETSITTVPSSFKANLLECAIIAEDIMLVKFLSKHISSSMLGYLGDLPLITACRTGNMYIVRACLFGNLDPFQKQPDGSSFFHWIFMLGAEVRFIFEIQGLLDLKEQKEVLDTPCVAPKALHPQWPLQLLGTPLAFSIAACSFTGVAALLQLGADPLAPVYSLDRNSERNWWTPLHLAVKYHCPDMLVLLLLGLPKHEVDLDALILASIKARLAKVPYIFQALGGRKSPLAKALRNCHRSVSFRSPWDDTIGCALSYSTTVERLAIHSIDHEKRLAEITSLLPVSCFTMSSKDGRTPLMQAIDFNDISVVMAILKRVPKLVKKVFLDPLDGQFVYPIHFASQVAGHRDADDAVDILKLLILYDPDQMNVRDSKGKSALFFAVTGPSDRATKWLIKNGCPITETNNEGQTALHSAQSTRNIVALIDAGIDVNQQDKTGKAPIHVAVSLGSEDLVKTLLNRGANLNLKDSMGKTALHCAIEKRSREVCRILLDAGAWVNSQTNSGVTPLHMAVQSTRSDIVKLLLDSGADISATNSELCTPLHQSVLTGDYVCFNRILLSVHHQDPTSVNAINLKNHTPLHIAAILLRINMAEKLLQFGALADMTDEDGNNVFHLVVDCGTSPGHSQADRVDFLSLLYTHWTKITGSNTKKSDPVAAQLNTENANGKIPWDLAYQQKSFMLMDFLIVKAGFDVCRQLQLDGEYIGNKLLNCAIEADEWDLVISLMRYNSVAEMHSILHTSGDELNIALRMSDKSALKKILEQGGKDSKERPLKWLDGEMVKSSLFRPWRDEKGTS